MLPLPATEEWTHFAVPVPVLYSAYRLWKSFVAVTCLELPFQSLMPSVETQPLHPGRIWTSPLTQNLKPIHRAIRPTHHHKKTFSTGRFHMQPRGTHTIRVMVTRKWVRQETQGSHRSCNLLNLIRLTITYRSKKRSQIQVGALNFRANLFGRMGGLGLISEAGHTIAVIHQVLLLVLPNLVRRLGDQLNCQLKRYFFFTLNYRLSDSKPSFCAMFIVGYSANYTQQAFRKHITAFTVGCHLMVLIDLIAV